MSIRSILKAWNSLRTRIFLIVLIMLLPSSALMYSSYHSILGSLDSITDIVDTPLTILVSAKRIQSKILRTELPFHLYLNRGESADRETFIKLSIEVDILFDIVMRNPKLIGKNSGLFKTSKTEWQSARTLGENLLTLTNIPENKVLIEKIEQFARHIERSASMLDEISETSLENIKDIRFIAQDTEWKNIGLLSFVFGLGMLLALLAAISLGHSVIEPIQRLEKSVNRFGEGDTSARIHFKSNDELGSLAQAFNLLAERYEHIQFELNRLSTHDNLTGLYDHTKLHQEVVMEIERAKRYDRAFSIIHINIDNFTEVKNAYGRLIGDSILCSVANTIRNTIRPTDIAARYSHYSFAIVLSETDAQGSIETSQRIYEAIHDKPLNIGDGNLLSISIGINTATYPTDAETDTALFALIEEKTNSHQFTYKARIKSVK